jgi:hypothetical protein
MFQLSSRSLLTKRVDPSNVKHKQSKLNVRKYAAACDRVFNQLKLIKYHLRLISTAFASSKDARERIGPAGNTTKKAAKLYDYFKPFESTLQNKTKALLDIISAVFVYKNEENCEEDVVATLEKLDALFKDEQAKKLREVFLQFGEIETVLFKLLSGGADAPGYAMFPTKGYSSVAALERSFKELSIDSRFADILRTLCNDVWYPMTQASDQTKDKRDEAGLRLIVAKDTFASVLTDSHYVLGHCKCDDGEVYEESDQVLYSCKCDDTECNNNYFIRMNSKEKFEATPQCNVPRTFDMELMHHDVLEYLDVLEDGGLNKAASAQNLPDPREVHN